MVSKEKKVSSFFLFFFFLHLRVIVIKIKQLPHLFRGEPGEAVTSALGAWRLVDMRRGLTCPPFSGATQGPRVTRVSVQRPSLSPFQAM